MNRVPFFCGKDCGGCACPLLAQVEDGKVTRVTNNPAGGVGLTGCARGYRLPEELYSPDRLTAPLVRSGPRGSGEFREASWDEALDLVAARLAGIRKEHGDTAVLNLGSWGQVGALHNTHALLSRFLNLGGGATALTSNYSNGAAQFILPWLLGEDWKRAGFDAATMRHSRMIILWGANVLEARLGPDLDRQLLAARDRGAQIVVVDPRRSLSARRLGARWLPCRPGTDAALLLAVLHTMLTENLADRGFAESRARGFDRLAASVLGLDGSPARTPAWAAGICGLPVAEIRAFARDWATAKPALLLPGLSIQRVFAGEEAFRLTVALQLATGNFGRLGGSTGALNNRLPQPRLGGLPVPPNPVAAHAPVVRWPDLILEGRAGGWLSDIRAAYACGSNLLNQGADTAKAKAAFSRLDFAVCHELFLTPTARHCDVVLPVAHALEKEDLAMPWAGNFLAYKPRAVEPPPGVKSDYAIFAELAARLGYGEAFTGGLTEAQWVERFIRESAVEDAGAFRRTGVYFGAERERSGLADFAADPAAHPLATPSGLVELYSEAYAAATGFPALPGWRDRPHDARFPLSLITPKHLDRTHSQGGGSAAALAAQALAINPADAAARGIASGQAVRVSSATGELRVAARVDPDIMPGVVSLPEGIWHRPGPGGVDLAGSANQLTATDPTRPSQANIMHGVAVEVAAWPDGGDGPIHA
jgi:anaerobic selenocysteine-containing dehydrogenase